MKKEQSSKNIIIPYLIGFVYFVYALIMFIVPRCRYNDAKNEHETMKPPNSAIIAFHFVFHIVFTALIIGIIGCFHNYFTHFKCKCFEYFTIVMFAGGCGPSLIFYILSLVFGICKTINPANVISPEKIHEYINKSSTRELMGYVYAYGGARSGRNRFPKYSGAYVFKINMTKISKDEFNEDDYPDIYGFEIKYNSKYDDLIKNYFEEGKKRTKNAFYENGYKASKYFSGIYPDFQDVNYVSKTGHYKGKYSQSARVAAVFFAVATYYDHTTSSIPYYSMSINRTLECDTSETPTIDTSYYHEKPNLEKLYNNFYK